MLEKYSHLVLSALASLEGTASGWHFSSLFGLTRGAGSGGSFLGGCGGGELGRDLLFEVSVIISLGPTKV